MRIESRTEWGQGLCGIAAAALALGAGCAVTEECRPRVVTPTSEIANAPETVVVAGKELWLRTDIARDFMPVQSEEGSCLRGAFQVVTADSSSPPDGLSASFAWVIYRGRAWQTPLGGPSNILPWGLIFRPGDGGPRWPPGDSVDVVIALSHLGQRHLLRAPDQRIQRTE